MISAERAKVTLSSERRNTRQFNELQTAGERGTRKGQTMRDTKAMKVARFYDGMARLGIGHDDANKLRRIEMALHRWAELECGDGNEYGSWAIERDDETDKPYMVRHYYGHGSGTVGNGYRMTRTRIADREAGALRRLGRILAAYPDLVPYHQTDPRGCALYLVNKADLNGTPIDQCYSRGFGVCY